MSTNQSTNNTTPDWRELRRQERAERRATHGNSGWIFGAVLILVGALLFLQNVSIVTLHNWWALFILLPAFGSLATAWQLFRTQGEFSAGAVGSLLVGLLLTGVAAVFLFNLDLDWTLVAPAVLILLGIGMLLPALFRRN